MRTPPALLAILLLTACAQQDQPGEVPPVHAPAPVPPAVQELPDSTEYIVLHSLAGSGLRFNGVYQSSSEGGIHYIMRFFERGNVVLVAGKQQPGDPVDLKSYLVRDAKSGTNNVHNSPVTWRNDSLFFSTMAVRGAITYAGTVDADSVRFLKHSRATGKKALVTYRFIPD